ncbi:MAG: Hcp family type VI secretion system effector [Hyphomicrobiales bacterium]
MAVDMILKLDGIKGESKIDGHAEEIDVLAWSWGLSNSASGHTGGGSGSGKVSVQDLSFTKYVDKASPTLKLKCSKGDHIKDGTLFVRKAGGEKPLDYIKLKMEQILVTSISTGGSGGEDKLTESITLNFAKVEEVYTGQKEDGSADKAVEYKWNIAEHKAA